MNQIQKSAMFGALASLTISAVFVVLIQNVQRSSPAIVPVADPVMETYHEEARSAANDYRQALMNSPLTQRHCRALSSFGEVMYRQLYLDKQPRSYVRAMAAEALYRSTSDPETVKALGGLMNIAFAEGSNAKPVNPARFADEVFDRCLSGLGVLPSVDPGPDPAEAAVSARPMM